MVLDLQLYTCRLSSDHEAAENLALHPDFPILTDLDAIRDCRIIFIEPFENVHLPLVCDKFLLALPVYSDARSYFISECRKPRAEINGGGRGLGQRELEQESGDSATGMVVVGRKWRVARCRKRMNRVRRG